MNLVNIRDVKIGEGIPKVCVPIIGQTRADILNSAKRVKFSGADLAEWRADWYENISFFAEAEKLVKELREVLENIPLLFTFRTAKEGGKKAIVPQQYLELNKKVIRTKAIDLVDVELFAGDSLVRKTIEIAHEENVKVVVSNHDFEKTPTKADIISRLCKMQKMGADISKIAVMPVCKKDVLTLLSATEEMYTEHADRPFVTMSMGRAGMISRVCGEVFGSAITFGANGTASAPGQMDVKDLQTMLQLMHGASIFEKKKIVEISREDFR